MLQVKEVPEFELVATQLYHDKTRAEHLHIAREDKNNVFAIGFGTPSLKSTGVAHILVYLCQLRLTARNIQHYAGAGNILSEIPFSRCSIGVTQTL